MIAKLLCAVLFVAWMVALTACARPDPWHWTNVGFRVEDKP